MLTGSIIGYGFLESVYEKALLIEIKSVRRIIKEFEVQLVNYLTATGKPVGLLLNFGEKKDNVKRKVRAFEE